MKKRAALALLLIGSISLSSAAQSPDDVARAKESFRAGASAYSVGDYEAAIQALEAAYELTPLPAIAFSLAQAERKQYFADGDSRHVAQALALFERYLAEAPQGARRADAVDAIAQLERIRPARVGPAPPPSLPARPTRLMVVAEAPGARIVLDDSPPAASPVIREVAPGKHRVRVEAAGFSPTNREATAVAGELILTEVRLQELQAKLAIHTPEGAEVYLDGAFVGVSDDHVTLAVPAGTHRVAVAQKGRKPVYETVELSRGQARSIRLTPDVSPQRTVSMILVGAGGAALGAGLVLSAFAVRAQNRAEDFLARRAQGNVSQSALLSYRASVADRDRIRLATGVSLASATGLFVSGLLLHELDHRAPLTSEAPEMRTAPRSAYDTSRRRVRFLPAFAGSECSASLEVAF